MDIVIIFTEFYGKQNHKDSAHSGRGTFTFA